MEKYYIKSLQRIKELGQVLDYTEWNRIAKEEGYLSSESLQYISGKKIKKLCKNVARNGKYLQKF